MSSPEVRTIRAMEENEQAPDGQKIAHSTRELRGMDQVNPKEILVEIPYRPDEGIHPLLVENLIHWGNQGVSIALIRDNFQGWIDVLRNWMLYRFLQQTQYKFLLMVDSDIAPIHPLSIFKLAANDLPIVSGVACSLSPAKGLFACIAVKDDKGVARFPSMQDGNPMPSEGLVEVENAGTGFLMIRRDLAETLWNNAFLGQQTSVNLILDEIGRAIKGGSGQVPTEKLVEWRESLYKMLHHMDDSGLPFDVPVSVRTEAAKTGALPRSEDICFTDRCRRSGFKLFADLAVHCTHAKQLGLRWPEELISSSVTVEEWTRSAAGLPAVRV